MSRLQLTDAKGMEKILLTIGFTKVRQKGSHAYYLHADGRRTTIPFHVGHDLARPLIRAIISEIGLTPEEYHSMLKE